MNLVDLAEGNYHKWGEYPYLVFGEKEYTNLKLLSHAKRACRGLKNLGLGRGDKVVVMLPNCPEVLISYQAILRAGGIIVPVMPLLSPPELEHILRNSRAAAIITNRELLPKVHAAVKDTDPLQHLIIIVADQEALPGTVHFWELAGENEEDSEPARPDDHDLAVIIYTSGTTGLPKGVMLTHHNLYSNAVNTAAARAIKRTEVHLAALPLSHSFGITVMNTSFIFGNLWVLMPRFKAEEAFRLIDRHRINNFAGVPAMFSLMLLVPPEVRHKYDLSSLKNVSSGSAPLPVETFHAFHEQFHCAIAQGYGLSEASPVVSVHYHDRDIKPDSVGQPIPETQVRIVDQEGRELPPGQVGELVVKGPNVSPGYYQMPEETARTFRNGWLYTGDMARMDEDGYLYIVERKKDLIIRGGFNIYPREVEEVLLRHPAVQEASVIGVPDPVMGEEVRAFVVLKSGNTAAEQNLIDFCQHHLSKNKCPRMVQFLPRLPKNSMGKILRKELRRLAQKVDG